MTKSKKSDKVKDPVNPENEEGSPFDDVTGEWGDEGWDTASAIIWQPEPGHELQGVYGGKEPFTEGTLDSDAMKHYVIERGSTVRHSFVGGQVFDRLMAQADICEGDLVKIVFLGQKDCKAGRVNLFDIKYKKAAK